MQEHKFSIGQRVGLSRTPGTAAARGDYEVVRLLPSEDGQHLYRIKSALEPWERVVAEDQLALRP